MKGNIVIVALVSVIIYPLLVAVFFFATPFMVSWGSPMPWYLRVINFLQETPFSLTQKNGEVNLSLVFINAFFWTACIGALLYFLLRKKNSKAAH